MWSDALQREKRRQERGGGKQHKMADNNAADDNNDDDEDFTLSRSTLLTVAVGNYVIGRVLDEVHVRQRNHVIALAVYHGLSFAAYAWFYYSSTLVTDAAKTQLTDNTGKLPVEAQTQLDSITMGGRMLVVAALSQAALLIACILLVSGPNVQNHEYVGAVLNTITVVGGTAAIYAMVKLSDPAADNSQ
jgi:hypothetical protein